jgi:hypothetical protein
MQTTYHAFKGKFYRNSRNGCIYAEYGADLPMFIWADGHRLKQGRYNPLDVGAGVPYRPEFYPIEQVDFVRVDPVFTVDHNGARATFPTVGEAIRYATPLGATVVECIGPLRRIVHHEG